ncbi:MAG TPA: hypothetical protein PKA27_17450 [Fimbriimonadaceae bacterium]|nr:hypothetical protein [Fimbriimonadaceae bacterium]
MIWLAVGGMIALAGGALFIFLSLHGVWSLRHSNGMFGFGNGQSTSRMVDRTQLMALFERLLRNDRYDQVFFSEDEDQSSGFSISLRGASDYVVNASFSTVKDHERQTAFRHAMSSLNLALSEEFVFNEGMGDDEALSLTYTVPADPAQMVHITNTLVDALYPGQGHGIFADAWKIGKGPRLGLTYSRNQDLLEGVVDN